MPNVFGIPLIGFIQMVLGTGIIVFLLIKFLTRPKKNKKGEYLINDVHIIVGDGTEKEHQYVYIKDGKIMELSDQPIEKKNVQIIDGEDKTLMPSLIDSHIHIQGGFKCHSEEESDVFLNEEMPRIFSEDVLPYGITTIKDLDAPKHFICKLRDKLRSGEITGPELLIVGPNFTTPEGHPANTLGTNSEWARNEMAITVTTPEEVSAGIKELKEAGVDFLKVTYQGGDYWYFDKKITIQKIDKELMKQIIREGEENGLKSTAHVFYYDDVWELLEAGIYGIEHGILDRDIEPDDPIIELWKKSGAHFVPTVNAMTYEKDPTRMAHSIHNLKVIYDAGIPIAMGTDNMFETMAGNVEHKELEYYVEAGLTPMQAIMLATKNGAEHLGIADRKGKKKTIQSYDVPDFAFPENLKTAEYFNSDTNESRIVNVERFESEGIITQTILRNGEDWAQEEFTLEKNLSAVKWHYSRPSDNTKLDVFRENGMIYLKGTFKGKEQDKSYKIGDGLWYQMMDMSLPAFAASKLDEILFYPIGTGDNRGALSLGEFAAKKLGDEEVTVNGKTFSCTKVSLVLTMFSWAWTGLFWYDKETNMLIQSGVKKGNKEIIAQTIKELKYK